VLNNKNVQSGGESSGLSMNDTEFLKNIKASYESKALQ
jgi:hypothetical protein